MHTIYIYYQAEIKTILGHDNIIIIIILYSLKT